MQIKYQFADLRRNSTEDCKQFWVSLSLYLHGQEVNNSIYTYIFGHDLLPINNFIIAAPPNCQSAVWLPTNIFAIILLSVSLKLAFFFLSASAYIPSAFMQNEPSLFVRSEKQRQKTCSISDRNASIYYWACECVAQVKNADLIYLRNLYAYAIL